MEPNSMFDQILEEFAAGAYAEQVLLARRNFFEQLSDLREDDPSYERLTGCFLNWYVYDLPMAGGQATALQLFAGRPERTAEQVQECERLAANLHSLFELLRLEDGGLRVVDLFSQEELFVNERRHLAGLERGDLMEARLLPLAERLVFSPDATIMHARAARDHILAAVGRARRDGRPKRQELLAKLRALTFRFSDRYRERVPVEKVFGELENFTGLASEAPLAATQD